MSCQIVERCQAKGYCPASIPPPRRRKLRILCFRLKGGKRSRSAAPPLPSEPADAGLPRGPESRATSLYTREALVHTFRHCSPLTLGFPGAPIAASSASFAAYHRFEITKRSTPLGCSFSTAIYFKYASTALAHALPSTMAFTTRLWPVRQSPQAKIFSTLVW